MSHCLKHKGNYSDEFWMLQFKVVPCTKTYAHSWSSCPCAHPGETARRRDPTIFNYQPVLCPNVKSKSGCPSGDACGMAHNVFEQWLHPQRYKALMCTYGSQCTRPSCFFAHSLEELRVPWKGGAGAGAGGAGGASEPKVSNSGSGSEPTSGSLREGQEQGVGSSAGFRKFALGAGLDAGAFPGDPMMGADGFSGFVAAADGLARPGVLRQAGAGGFMGVQRVAGQQQLQLQHQQQQQYMTGPLGGGHAVIDVRTVAGARAGQGCHTVGLLGSSTSGILADRAGGPHQHQQQHQQHNLHRGPHPRQPGHASAPHELLDPHPDPFSSLSAASTAAAAAAAAANANADGPVPQATLGALSSSNSHPLSALYRTTSAASGLQPRPLQDELDGAGPMPGLAAARSSTHSVSLSPHMLNTPLSSLPLGLQLQDAGASEPNSATSLMALQQGSMQQHQQQQLGLSGLTPVGIYVGGMAPGAGMQQGVMQQGGPGGVGVAVQQGRSVQAPGPQLQHHLQQLHQHQAAMQQLRMAAVAGQQQQQQQQQVANSPTMAQQQQQQQQRGGAGVFVVQSHQALHQQQLQYPQHGPGGLMVGAGSNAGGNASQSATADLSAASLALAGGSTSTLDASEAELELLPGPGTVGGWGLAPRPGQGYAAGPRTLSGASARSSITALADGPFGQQQQQAPGAGPPLSGGQRRMMRSPSGLADGAVSSGESLVVQQMQGLQLQQQQSQLQHEGSGKGLEPVGEHQQATYGLGPGGARPQPGAQQQVARRQHGSSVPGVLGVETSLADGPNGPVGQRIGPVAGGAGAAAALAAAGAAAAATMASATANANGGGGGGGCSQAVEPEVEALLLSSLQLQLANAGLGGQHSAVAGFPLAEWLQQALRGQGTAATRTYVVSLLAQFLPPEQLEVVRRLLECLDEASTLLSCFAPGAGAGAGAGPGAGMGAGMGAGAVGNGGMPGGAGVQGSVPVGAPAGQ